MIIPPTDMHISTHSSKTHSPNLLLFLTKAGFDCQFTGVWDFDQKLLAGLVAA